MPQAAQSFTLPKRFYVPRCIGLSLGFLAVFASMPSGAPHHVVLATLILYCFAWPHLAYLLARLNTRPIDTERRSMLVDAFATGFFSGAMGFNPIPSVAIVTMISMNNMAMGGPRFMTSGLCVSALGAALAYWALKVPFDTSLTQSQILACLPLLVLYPISLGYVCYLTAIKLKAQKKQLSEMSRTDHLTGLANRGALNEILDQSFHAPRISLDNSVIALIDVDGFKQINDTFGHSAGDQTLQKISEIMRACVRENDTVGRYGGDEFCVILRNVTKAEAISVFERMRALAEQNGATVSGENRSTLSIGAAMYSPKANTSAMWIHLADAAMYQAKRGGRNKVVFAA
jgi:diguanylate cyclase